MISNKSSVVVTVVGRRREDGKRVVSAPTSSGHVRRVLLTVEDDDIPPEIRHMVDRKMDAGDEPCLHVDTNMPISYDNANRVRLGNWRPS